MKKTDEINERVKRIYRYLSDARYCGIDSGADSKIQNEITAVVMESAAMQQRLDAATKTKPTKLELSQAQIDAIAGIVLKKLKSSGEISVQESADLPASSVVKVESPKAEDTSNSVSPKSIRPEIEKVQAPAPSDTEADKMKKEDKPAVTIRRILYASAYDDENKCFFKVNEKPFDEAVYEISLETIDSSKGMLDIYGEAQTKILECRDFLDFCCETSGSGNTITTLEKGTVVLCDGKWKSETKLKVKFQ